MVKKLQGEIIGENVPFTRIRRITGYLVGDMDRWNDAKKAEESQRVKHDLFKEGTEIQCQAQKIA